MEENDPSYIKLPTAVALALIGAVGVGGAGAYGVIRPGHNGDALASIRKDINDIRATARAALTLSTQNGQRVIDTRTLVFDRTQGRYSAEHAAKDWREQEERNQQHERRLRMIERELDKLADVGWIESREAGNE